MAQSKSVKVAIETILKALPVVLQAAEEMEAHRKAQIELRKSMVKESKKRSEDRAKIFGKVDWNGNQIIRAEPEREFDEDKATIEFIDYDEERAALSNRNAAYANILTKKNGAA